MYANKGIDALTPVAPKPSTGRSLWLRWKRMGKRIGDVQARLLLLLFYFVVLGPFALAVRWGSDPLAIKANTPRGWRLLGDKEGTPMQQAMQQF